MIDRRVIGGVATIAAGAAAIALALTGAARDFGAPSLALSRRLVVGQEKSIGDFDPHLHLLLERAESGPASEGGRRLLVTMRVRNDAARIEVDASRLTISVLDRQGRAVGPREVELGDGGRILPVLDVHLRPGESARRTLAFDLPPGFEPADLWIRPEVWVDRYLPLTEISLIAPRRVTWALDPAARADRDRLATAD